VCNKLAGIFLVVLKGTVKNLSQKELEKTFHRISSDRIPEKITVSTKS
jgi:hypothetical protein